MLIVTLSGEMLLQVVFGWLRVMILLLIFLFLQSQQLFQVEEKSLIPTRDTLITTSWTVEEGLPVNTVNELMQDSTGYVWLTTYDGIVRFDGLNFKTYTSANTPGMPQNRAVFMQPQSNDKLWISLEHGGVLLKDGKNFSHYGSDQGFTDSNIIYMFTDSNGDIWFATFDGAHLYKDGEFHHVLDRDTDLKNQVNHIYEDPLDGSIWFATADGVVHQEDGEFHQYRSDRPGFDNDFRSIHRAPNGNLLIATRMGVYTLENDRLIIPDHFKLLENSRVHMFIQTADHSFYLTTNKGLYRYENGELSQIPGNEKPEELFTSFIEDRDGSLWLTNGAGEIYMMKNDRLSPFKINQSSESFHVNRLMKDREGNLWIGTARDGIWRVKTNPVKSVTTQNGLSGNNILGLFEDKNGTFWVGTRDFGLNKIENGTITIFNDNSAIPKNIVHSINQDTEGNIWVGYYNQGVVKFDAETGNQIAYSLGPTESLNDVRSVFMRSDSTIWLGTYGGLIHFDPDDLQHRYYTTEDGLSDNLIRYIDEDHNGDFWIGTLRGGVNHFKNGQFTSYTEEDGLASNNIRSVYVDEFDPGTVWVGTETNGISRIKNGEIHSVGTDDGLPDHVIHYISQDSLGYLWMSSNRGIIKIEKSSLNAYMDGTSGYFNIIHFNKSDGMLNPEANGSFQQGGLRTSDGHFWFATQEGVAIFSIQPKQVNTVPPTLLIQEVYAGGITYDVSSGGRVELKRGTQNFGVNYHALTFASPEKTRFRYRLLGYQDEWTEIYNERTVSFSELRAGDYTFQLLSANNQGVWNSEPVEATIIVTDYFYNQWWFFPLLVVLIFLGYIPASKLRYRYLLNKQKNMQAIINKQTAEIRKEKQELEKRNKIIEEQSEQLRELNDTKDKFFSIIAHDLRNPFQAILGFTELLIEDAKESENWELKENLEHIDIAGRRVFNLLENLLKWASLQSGRIKSKEEFCWIDNILKHTKKLLEHQAGQKNISINVLAPPDVFVYGDSNMLRTIFQNLVSNAIKFSEEGSEIKIIVEEHSENVTISVCDEGIGMPEEMVDKLMKLDSNTSRPGTSEEKGSGLGLIITRELVSIQNGSLKVESVEGEGTTFTILLPKKKAQSASL